MVLGFENLNLKLGKFKLCINELMTCMRGQIEPPSKFIVVLLLLPKVSCLPFFRGGSLLKGGAHTLNICHTLCAFSHLALCTCKNRIEAPHVI